VLHGCLPAVPLSSESGKRRAQARPCSGHLQVAKPQGNYKHLGNKPVASDAFPRLSATCFVSLKICSSGLQAWGFPQPPPRTLGRQFL